MEDISGRTPGVDDLKDCERTIRLLHESGILHGDVNRYNFLMTDCGAIVFDFEVATIKEVVASKESDNEIKTLVEKFKDNSGVGKR
jgi:RIO-like serine/threonine protein kinase